MHSGCCLTSGLLLSGVLRTVEALHATVYMLSMDLVDANYSTFVCTFSIDALYLDRGGYCCFDGAVPLCAGVRHTPTMTVPRSR